MRCVSPRFLRVPAFSLSLRRTHRGRSLYCIREKKTVRGERECFNEGAGNERCFERVKEATCWHLCLALTPEQAEWLEERKQEAATWEPTTARPDKPGGTYDLLEQTKDVGSGPGQWARGVVCRRSCVGDLNDAKLMDLGELKPGALAMPLLAMAGIAVGVVVCCCAWQRWRAKRAADAAVAADDERGAAYTSARATGVATRGGYRSG